MLYEITAKRSDGLECGGTVDCPDSKSAMKQCRSTFKTFVVRSSGIVCGIHLNKRVCYEHTGTTLTFSNHAIKEI